MSAQLNISGNIIELDTEITYNFQVADIADFSKMKSNYTSSFQIPKTTDTVLLFEGLGIPSDTSTIPYRINNVQCLDDYAVVYSGVLVVLRTDDLYYHCTVISGINDLITELGDATIFDAIQNMFFYYIKDVFDVYSGLRAGYASFLLADYYPKETSSNRYNIDAMPQSVPISPLLDEIFNLVGYTYSLPASIDLTNEMLLVPMPPLIDYIATGSVIGRVLANGFFINPTLSANQEPPFPVLWSGYSGGPEIELLPGNNQIRITSPGTFKLETKQFYADMRVASEFDSYGMIVQILLNGNVISQFIASTFLPSEANQIITIVSSTGSDIITFRFLTPQNNVPLNSSRQYRYGGRLEFSFVAADNDKLSKYIDMRAADFIKELSNRYMLQPVQEGTHVDFISMFDTLNNFDSVNWSDKYIKRTEERYTLDYAQNNWLRHSYVDDNADHYDLDITSNNQNIPISKDIFESKIFAPDTNGVFEVYDVEPGTPTKIKTNKRFFFAKADRRLTEAEYVLMSSSIPGTHVISSGVLLNFIDYTAAFNQSVRWPSLSGILDNTRIHNIELNLNILDVTSLDFTKLYYFDQESSYYILNTLRYTKGQKAVGEFVKINLKEVTTSIQVIVDNYTRYDLRSWTSVDSTELIITRFTTGIIWKIGRNILSGDFVVTVQSNSVSSIFMQITDEGSYTQYETIDIGENIITIPSSFQGNLNFLFDEI